MTRLLMLIAVPALAGDVSGLAWMTGCWVTQAGKVTIEEQWNKPAGGQMMGISRTIRDGKVAFSEFMRIDTKGAAIVYTPRIGTRAAAVEFMLTSQTATEVVFENPAHDFPQRILYRKDGDGLFARIDGVSQGKARAEDFPMRAMPCR